MSNRLAAHVGLWRNPVQFAIDQGPMVMALANYLHPGMVHDWVLSDSNVLRVVTNLFASASLDLNVTLKKSWVATNGDTACELMWQAPSFDRTRRHVYTAQSSANLLSDSWQDRAGPLTNRVWIARSAATNAFMAYRIRASD